MELLARELGRDEIDLGDNFFDLGGHSLLATVVVSRIREAFSISLPLRSLFDHPTVGELAPIVDQAVATGPTASSPQLKPLPR